ncbi:c-type cytochrome [Solimonas terrae]|uniref:Cytochrome c n=1 Tax=Solimonas terrae TaxID=1396819 RepID=A0A6M2BWJ4_9GAMM|nr:cytochrome c [Solimonas terrae]NGY06720.1 cytochrome c [Solimonas terrae]
MKATHAVMLAVLLGSTSLAAQASDLTSSTIFSHGYVFEEKTGEALYQGICQGCHMPDARGATGAGTYPALAGNPRLATRQYPMVMVLNGGGAMPSFASSLDDAQISAVVNYVRSHFGNHYTDSVTAAEVKAVRGPSGASGE